MALKPAKPSRKKRKEDNGNRHREKLCHCLRQARMWGLSILLLIPFIPLLILFMAGVFLTSFLVNLIRSFSGRHQVVEKTVN